MKRDDTTRGPVPALQPDDAGSLVKGLAADETLLLGFRSSAPWELRLRRAGDGYECVTWDEELADGGMLVARERERLTEAAAVDRVAEAIVNRYFTGLAILVDR